MLGKIEPLGQGVRPRLCHVVKDEGGFGFSVTQGELRVREGSAGVALSPVVGGQQAESHSLGFQDIGVLSG